MNDLSGPRPTADALPWSGDGTHRIPYEIYTDPALYQRELQKLFYAQHWSYVGLDAEIPNVGDFKRTVIGERSVVMVRGRDNAIWTHFGFEDDTEEMTERRLIQANLFGPSGYVSADDGEVIEFSQMGYRSREGTTRGGASVVEMGGRDSNEGEVAASETLIRGMYEYWRSVMQA